MRTLVQGTLCVLALSWVFSLGCESRSSPQVVPPRSADQSPKPASVTRGGMEFIQGYDRGFQLAQEQKKPMLLFFTATWCRYCHEMERDAFVQTDVIQLSKEFVCVLVDADLESSVCGDFGVRGYPTVQFVSPDGVKLNRLVGRSSGAELASQMQAALKAVGVRMAALSPVPLR